MNCPICNDKMQKMDDVGSTIGLPSNCRRPLGYYHCTTCYKNYAQNRSISKYAYQRTVINGIWYFYRSGKWNRYSSLDNSEINPSKRKQDY